MVPLWALEFRQFPCTMENEEDLNELHISSLPAELISTIFGFLDAKSVDRSSRVCKYWFLLSREVRM